MTDPHRISLRRLSHDRWTLRSLSSRCFILLAEQRPSSLTDAILGKSTVLLWGCVIFTCELALQERVACTSLRTPILNFIHSLPPANLISEHTAKFSTCLISSLGLKCNPLAHFSTLTVTFFFGLRASSCFSVTLDSPEPWPWPSRLPWVATWNWKSFLVTSFCFYPPSTSPSLTFLSFQRSLGHGARLSGGALALQAEVLGSIQASSVCLPLFFGALPPSLCSGLQDALVLLDKPHHWTTSARTSVPAAPEPLNWAFGASLNISLHNSLLVNLK